MLVLVVVEWIVVYRDGFFAIIQMLTLGDQQGGTRERRVEEFEGKDGDAGYGQCSDVIPLNNDLEI